MGYAVSWLAFQGLTAEQALARLGLVDTGAPDPEHEAPASGGWMPGDWYVVSFDAFAPPALEPAALARLSAGCVVLGCQVEEHAMYSVACLYEDGALLWRVRHDAQQALQHLETEGAPPALLDGLHADALVADGRGDGSVDYMFDVPVNIARALCGFRHDEESDGFTVLSG